MRFDAADRLVDDGFDKDALEAVMQSGKPFQTSDRPDPQDDVSACNCPYGDSMAEDIRSFRFAAGCAECRKGAAPAARRGYLHIGRMKRMNKTG
jgi:hypothetical protein